MPSLFLSLRDTTRATSGDIGVPSALMLSAWAGGNVGTPAPTPPCSNLTPTAEAVKPILTGLVTTGTETRQTQLGALSQSRLLEINAHVGVYAAAVIQATWSRLEPQPRVFDDNVIDAALQNIAADNAQHPATPSWSL